jgi:selenobiotic family peptide radical SAM maturase
MNYHDIESLKTIYPRTARLMGPAFWNESRKNGLNPENPEAFPEILDKHVQTAGLPRYLPDLARLEITVFAAKNAEIIASPESGTTEINPSVQLFSTSWPLIVPIFNGEDAPDGLIPEGGERLILVWKRSGADLVQVREATDEDLLVLKMVAEGIRARTVAAMGGIPVSAVRDALDRAVDEGLLIRPLSRIRRPSTWPSWRETTEDETFRRSNSFTLQWHVTQACDLHCAHCYDRSERETMPLKDAYAGLDDFDRFCSGRNVRGYISFSGGNPLLYPHFITLYRRASEYGFGLAILGNPASREEIEELTAIRKPDFFQVSLEGLEGANDAVRGPGHFDRTLRFLDLLRELDVYSMVMLTLTEANVDQVLPLAGMLRNRADVFHFNRLSMTGEGARLSLPSKEKSTAFFNEYLAAAKTNPVLGLKESLMNTYLYEKGMELFGGCAGYGCGAAFNFVALLPDGEVHACRKFPSLIGNVRRQSIEEIYSSKAAGRYRERPPGCRDCPLCLVCGGCLAVIHGLGHDDLGRDPYCFMGPPGSVVLPLAAERSK